MSEDISYKLQVFEGPLDLLLHLISKHKLNIYDIPIVQLVDQYTGYVRQMQSSDMEVASEFLEMAARLVYIKTVSLLPQTEEAEELKKELTGELIEYRDCRVMAVKLGEMAKGFDFYSKEPMPLPSTDMTYDRRHEPDEIMAAYIAAAGRGKRKIPPPQSDFTPYVGTKIVSVPSRIMFVLRDLLKRKKGRFTSLFASSDSKSEMVATFLAVLELIKSGRVEAEGAGTDPELTIVR